MPDDCKSFFQTSCLIVSPARNISSTFCFGLLLGVLTVGGTACTGGGANPDGAVMPTPSEDLVINEVMAQNEGAWIDERGETDDWIELVNRGARPLTPGDFWIQDAAGARERLRGPALLPGERRVLWADSDATQGDEHLSFKLKSGGDQLTLTDRLERLVDEVSLPELGPNESFARFPDTEGSFGSCRYASPRAHNGSECVPPAPPTFDDGVEFAAYALEADYPPARAALGVTELALRPEGLQVAYIELMNRGPVAVSLDDYTARLSPHAPNLPWPGALEGRPLSLPAGLTLAPGARSVVEVAAADLAELEADPKFEGVLTLFERASGVSVDRVDFMSWPLGTSLMQAPEQSASFRLCTNQTPGAENVCDQLASRPIGDRLRYLRTPGDYAALAQGDVELGIESVKFVVDLQAPGLVHLLSSARWPLHYTFVREHIYQQPTLDRCDAQQNAEFYEGWSQFSAVEYFRVEGRRFLLGTLSHHGGADLHAVEYTNGDVISSAQMKDGFFAVLPHTSAPAEWVLRPQDDSQVRRARVIEGSVPLVGPNAPFEGVSYQPLTAGVAYGTLRFVAAAELGDASLGPDVILVTDDVPNDIPLVGGLVTEAFQTPLAHVNVLSQSRGTPNASLKAARSVLAPFFDQLVRLEVSPAGVQVAPAEPGEALSYWETHTPTGPLVPARLDTSLRGVQALSEHGLGSLPAIGAKAAQLAALGAERAPWCGGLARIWTPEKPFAIPVVHSLEHLEASGARALLDELRTQPDFSADPQVRARGLASVRQLILEHPVDPTLLAQVEAAIRSRFGTSRVRFRSSSNTEDLPGFNGAGLYTSTSAELEDESRAVDGALRTVWASLYNARAYDERAYARIDDASVAMGVLVHGAFLGEQANGVAVSRNVLDPTRGDIYYLNAQAGEASVTNPAPGVTTEQLVYRWGREPPILYQSESSLSLALRPAASQVLGAEEVENLACALRTVHELFAPELNPGGTDPWFAMEVEFKLMGPERRLLIKQARPHSFGTPTLFGDCREL
jgi:pyruvate phosphate dikinase-like enzyme/lamin tail-like protein